MNSILIKKTSFVFFFILLILFYISLCVANKPDNLDNDYYVYFNAFNTNESKEISQSFARSFGSHPIST